MADNYLMRYKGTYRVLPELDKNTNDVPRNEDGSIANGYDDLYIPCASNSKIYAYDYDNDILVAYIPSIGRGHNIKKTLDSSKTPYEKYKETDAEIMFYFKAEFMNKYAEILKARTSGASINPFSAKNLLKNKDIKIPEEDLEDYKKIASKVEKKDLLKIGKFNAEFLETILQKTLKKKDKSFDYKSDIKVIGLATDIKTYIYAKELWGEYLKFMNDHIKELYNN